jgi:hypothetical protein
MKDDPPDKPYPPHYSVCHPDAPAFHAGAGRFRNAAVTGSDLGGDYIQVGAPAGRYLISGRRQEHQRRPVKVPPRQRSRLEFLADGASRLAMVRFGHALKDKKERFDTEWWDAWSFRPDPDKTDNDEWVALLKERRSPADAVLRIFDTLDKWSFDCAQFVQVALLYAVVKRLGKESFDKRVASNVQTRHKLMLRASDSTGLTVKKQWQHEIEELRKVNNERAAMLIKEQESRFKSAPNGSRIVFANLDPRSEKTAWQHENTIKMGADQFIAHGVMRNNPFVTREQIYDAIADAVPHGTSQLEDHIYKKNIYISTIQVFAHPDG